MTFSENIFFQCVAIFSHQHDWGNGFLLHQSITFIWNFLRCISEILLLNEIYLTFQRTRDLALSEAYSVSF